MSQAHIAQEIPLLFLPHAKIIWCGQPVPSTPPELGAFLESMPFSRHDLHTLDCHPIACKLASVDLYSANRSSFEAALDPSSGPAPDLMVNVTGSVLHGPSVFTHSDGPQIKPQDHPRKFHEIFLLRAAEQGEGMQPKVCLTLPSPSLSDSP